MFCIKCGNSINPGETFCTNCGQRVDNNINNMPVNNFQANNMPINNGPINLVISRPGKIMGCAVKLDVGVNGIHYKLGAGETLNLFVPAGDCRVTYNIWCRREKEVMLNIQPNRQYSIIFKYDALWGGFKVSNKSVLN